MITPHGWNQIRYIRRVAGDEPDESLSHCGLRKWIAQLRKAIDNFDALVERNIKAEKKRKNRKRELDAMGDADREWTLDEIERDAYRLHRAGLRQQAIEREKEAAIVAEHNRKHKIRQQREVAKRRKLVAERPWCECSILSGNMSTPDERALYEAIQAECDRVDAIQQSAL